MHEVGLVQQAIDSAVRAAKDAGAGSIEQLTFAITPGGHVTPEVVETLFAALSAGTPAAGAALAFEQQPGTVRCWSCGETFELSEAGSEACPSCGSESHDHPQGPELVLRYVDVA